MLNTIEAAAFEDVARRAAADKVALEKAVEAGRESLKLIAAQLLCGPERG
jgi:hypothetical protein